MANHPFGNGLYQLFLVIWHGDLGDGYKLIYDFHNYVFSMIPVTIVHVVSNNQRIGGRAHILDYWNMMVTGG